MKETIMAVPKRHQSHQRTRTRRAHDALSVPATSVCPKCREAKAPHRACSKCGYYKGKKVIEVREA
jgi:large subunit ribosomal protein L32